MRPKPRFFSKASCLFLVLFGLAVSFTTQAQTNLYSRATGNYNAANMWYTDAARSVAFGGTVGASHILNIGAGHTVTIPSNLTVTLAGIVVNDNSTSGTLLVGNNTNTATTLTINGNITVNTGGTFRAGGDGNGVHQLNVTGNITNNNVFNMIGASNDYVQVSFTGASAQTISGTGTTSFRNVTMGTSSSANVNVNQNISIAGVLSFTNAGLLVVNSTSNITMASGATFSTTAGSVSTATKYIQLDGLTGATGALVMTNNGTTAAWQITLPIGTTTGGYSPIVMSTVTTAPTAGATLTVKPIYNSSIQGQLRRTFRLVVAGNSAATTFDANFNYNQTIDVSAGDVLNNYTNLWYLNSGAGSWTSVGGEAPPSTLGYFSPTAAQTLANGTYYFTLGSGTAYPNTWYSYQSGVWSNWENWTLDPSGTTLVNGLNLPPQPGDEIVILNGFTITNDVAGQVTSSATIEGGATLDMVATTGNTLGTVSGSGILRIKGVSLPTGTYTSFVAAGTGGTVEYYDIGGTLPVGQATYNKLLLSNSTGSAIVYTMGSTLTTLTVNSDFNITQTGGGGTVTWQINDGNNTQRTVSVTGNLTVSSGGQIRVGTGNEASTNQHNITLNANLTNNGSIKFFDTADTEFSDASYTSGSIYTNGRQGNAATVTMSGVNDAVITANGLTDFYRLIINKGTGQQAMVSVNSSDVANFRLFATANLFSSGTQPNVASNCALSIVNGTLQLLGNINIPILIVNGSAGAPTDVFSIPQNGALWLNSPTVTVTVTNNTATNDDQRLQVNGLLRVTSGTLNCGYSRGIGSYSGGVVFIEGGTVNMWQYRPVLGGSNVFVYKQTGGTVNVGTTTNGPNGAQALAGVVDFVTEQFARFSLPTPTSSFQMSGGVLNVGTPSANTTLAGAQGIDIQSATSNYDVSGGTVNIYIPTGTTGAYDFGINATAPFYNLNVYRNSTATGTYVANIRQALTVLNNLTVISGVAGGLTTLNCQSTNLTVGGNFDLQSNTVFNTGTTATPSGANTITFNGSGAQSWTHNGSISNLTTVVVNKSNTLTLGGANTFPNITAALTLTSGTLADGGKTITVTGALSNSATHSGAGAIVYNTSTATSTIGGSGGTFGNLTLQPVTANGSNTVSTSGPQTVSGNLRLVGTSTTLNIASYSLKVLGNIYSDAGTGTSFSDSQRITTRGLPNDDGLTRQATSGADLVFPVGTTTTNMLYTPATINTTATTTGLITVTPVSGTHPNVTTTLQSVRYYWKVASSGFAGISAVTHKSYTYAGATRDAASTTYRPARYDQNTFSWAYGPAYNATVIPGTTTIPDFNTATWGVATTYLDGEYTAGNDLAFGTVTVYYSSSTPTTWSAASSWSTVAVGSPGGAGAPCATCPVVIGSGTLNHTIVNDADNQSCGSLQINTGSTLDCNTRLGLNFGVNNRGSVSGRGKIRISSGVFPAGDFSNFIGVTGGTVEWYGAMTAIPASGPAPQAIPLITYYNLIISPDAGVSMALPAIPTAVTRILTVYNDLTINAASTGSVITATTASRTVAVNGALTINSGRLSLQNGSTYTWIVNGTTTIESGAVFTVETGGTRTHTFTSSGSFINKGTVLFRSPLVTPTEVVNMTFTGAASNVFTTATGASTTLNTLVIDKGTDQTSSLTIDGTGTIDALTTGWVTLTNGTLGFNFTGTSGGTTPATFSLSTASSAFNVPASAKLKVQAGTVNVVTASNNAADLTLSGGVEVTGGTMNVGASGNNNNNDIEYAAAGIPTITVSGGTLYVNGSIRRSTATLSGALAFNQSGGTVSVGGRSSDNTRGVFEIENNTGSVFNLSGSSVLEILRPTGGTGYADLFLNPETSSVASTSTIKMGMNTATVQALRYNVAVPIGNYSVVGGGAGAQSVTMYSNDMTASGTISICSNCTLNTNALNVSVGADLNIMGTYNGAANTTTFYGSGSNTGTLSNTSSFLNMTVNKPSGTVSLTGTAPTLNNLNILDGVLNVGTMNLLVNRDITNNSSQIGSGTITLSGTSTSHAISSSNGSFTNLTLGATLAQAATKLVTVTGNMTIVGTLNFAVTSRYLYIKSSRLTFGTGATVTNAGTTAFIRTNGVSSDLGVVKNWAAGTQSFTYAVGTRFNYTPVTMNLTVNVPGSYTIIPVDDQHPTANAMGEQILNYYWIGIKDATLTYNVTGSVAYQYPNSLVGGASGDYRGAYLDAINLIGWTTSPPVATFTPAGTSTIMTFTNSLGNCLPGANGEFHYTAGTPGTAADPDHTLPNPITAVYSRFSDDDDGNATTVGTTGGNWNLATNWTLEDDGKGAGLSVVPVGRPIVILDGAKMFMNIAGLRAFKTTIESTGTLVVTKSTGETTSGHNLGTMSGTGTLQVKSSTLPAGNYTAFVSAAGGTIEYVSSGTLTMNNRSTYNNLSITGGTVVMTNTDLVLNGNVTVANGAELDNSANNRKMNVAKNFTLNGTGTFDPGTGTVAFDGTTSSVITGASSTFYGLEIAKTGSATLSFNNPVTVNGNLTMTSGNILSTAANMLIVSATGTTSGGSSGSFVTGPMAKVLLSGGSFTFPLGTTTGGSRYRSAGISNSTANDTWTVQYVGNNPTTDGYPNAAFNGTNIRKVSMFEYWLISPAAATTADVELMYNTGSYIANPTNIGNVANLRVAHWDGTLWDLAPGATAYSQTGTNVAGLVKATGVNSFSPFTFGSLDPDSPLPVKWGPVTAARLTNGVEVKWVTFQEIDNDHFEVERSDDGINFSSIGAIPGSGSTSMRQQYRFADTEASAARRYYYRIRQVDYGGASDYSPLAMVMPADGSEVQQSWLAYPNPLVKDVAFVISRSDSAAPEQVNVTLYSAQGVLLYQGTGTLEAVNTNVNRYLQDVRSGVYMLQVSDGTLAQGFKIVRP